MKNGEFTRAFGGNSSDRTFPRFHLETILDEAMSNSQGRAIYRDEERVEIINPGTAMFTKFVRRVTEEDRERWPEDYKRFKDGLEPAINGVPLEDWPLLKRAQVLMLKALEIRTVEDLANLSDIAVQRIGMGGMGLRAKAKAYLDDAEACALVERVTQRNEQLESTVATQGTQLQELKELCDKLFTEVQELRGRPNPILTATPAMDEAARYAPRNIDAPAPSSGFEQFASTEPPKRGRGRPPKHAAV